MKKLSKAQFNSLLKKRKLEDLGKIACFEKILKDGRGHVFKMPKRGSDVILLASGGLDSMTVWGILMKEYGLNVYPITFNRGEKRRKREFAAFKFFNEYYKERFPDNYRNFLNLDISQDNISIKIENGLEKLKEEVILSSIKNNELHFNVSLGIFTILPLFARAYAMFMNSTKGLNVNTIFCAVTADDGEYVPHQTLTSLRSIMCNMCVPMRDYSWQFASMCLEPEIGSFMKKSDLVKWGIKNNLPLEKTWSCYHATKYQCGGSDCFTCRARRVAFAEAKEEDKTIYASVEEQSVSIKNTKKLIKSFLLKIKRHLFIG